MLRTPRSPTGWAPASYFIALASKRTVHDLNRHEHVCDDHDAEQDEPRHSPLSHNLKRMVPLDGRRARGIDANTRDDAFSVFKQLGRSLIQTHNQRMGVVSLSVALLFLLLFASEVGIRIGRVRAHAYSADQRTLIVEIVAAMLGIAALLLGFSFSMAAQRFDERRLIIMDEANAIGTVYLRTRMIPEPERSQIRRELRSYIDADLSRYARPGDSKHAATDAAPESPSPEEKIWYLATAIAEHGPTALPNGLLIQSLNEMFDLETKRTLIFESHVPGVIAALLAAVSLCSLLTVGYAFGLYGRRNSPLIAVIAVAIAGTVFVIFDLDEPRSGLIHVSLKVMLDLRERISQVH